MALGAGRRVKDRTEPCTGIVQALELSLTVGKVYGCGSLPATIEAAGEGSLLFAITARLEGRRPILLMAIKLLVFH
jgi:hypothetical protein